MNITRNTFYFIITGLMMFTVAITSCDKDDNGSGPKISSITPSSVATGDIITISGSNFSNSTVIIESISAIITANTATSISTIVPAGATLGVQEVTITNSGGFATGSITVTAVGAGPVITDISPDSVSLGGQITITGTGLANAGVEIATIVTTTTANTATSITANIPSSGITVDQQASVRVTTSLGTIVSGVYVN